jgi:hypothetical protein
MGYFALGVYDSFFTTDYYQENTLGIAFSRNIYEYITIGATTNIYSKKYKKNHYIDDDPFIIENGYSKTALGLDIGTVFHPIENLNIGFVFRDINAPSIALGEGEDSVPRSLVVGSSYNYVHSDAFSIRPTFDFEYILENINSGNQVMYYMGGESWFLDKSIAVRGGYSKNKISFGTGVDFRNLGLEMGSFDIILDYTFNIYTGSLSEGGYAYNMGLIFEFGGEKEEVQ